MRFVEITHTYVIPVPADAVDVIEPLAREGMSIMEGFMSARAQNMRDLHSGWKLMPKEYQPSPVPGEDVETYTPARMPVRRNPDERDRLSALAAIEADADQGVSFAGDVMGRNEDPGPGHPWQQGLWIFPEGHPLSAIERHLYREWELGGKDPAVIEEFQEQIDA